MVAYFFHHRLPNQYFQAPSDTSIHFADFANSVLLLQILNAAFCSRKGSKNFHMLPWTHAASLTRNITLINLYAQLV